MVFQAENLWCQITHDLVQSSEEAFFVLWKRSRQRPHRKNSSLMSYFLDQKIILSRAFIAPLFWSLFCAAISEPFALLVCRLGTPVDSEQFETP